MHRSHSPIVLGLWPIAGITTIGVTQQDATSTIAKAIDCGITTFDTAFSYGFDGESDRLLGQFVKNDQDRFRVIGKVGQRWDAHRARIVDASPATLARDAEVSLQRIGIEQFDLLMLHSPDPNVPLEQSAEAMVDLQRRGLAAGQPSQPKQLLRIIIGNFLVLPRRNPALLFQVP
jgi:aryl-alcohol dehydrogenase-like predicted oxidoreductase